MSFLVFRQSRGDQGLHLPKVLGIVSLCAILSSFFPSHPESIFGQPAPVKPDLKRYSFTEPHMGTRFQIILYATNKEPASQAAKAAFERIGELDRIMSDYSSTSELMRLCQKNTDSGGGRPIPVSKELFFVLSQAQDVSRRSEGAFDVTVGPVVRLWRRARKTKQMPDPQELTKARGLVGYENMRLDPKNRTVQLMKTGMALDLGGIGKGYAADEALEVLSKKGIGQALVAASGDIAVSGAPPGKPGWNIGIAPLENPDAKPSRYLLLHDAAVSTSGDAEQFVEINGKRYSHIVDPKTGLGLVGRSSVTVVARRGVVADPLTKVVSVLGPQKGLEFIEATDGAAAYIVRKTDGNVEKFQSKRFPKEN